MAKKMLTSAPLVHSLIHLKFSDIPSLSSMSENLLNNLHNKMIEEGFPEKIISVFNVVEIVFDQQSQESNRVTKSVKRILFRAAGEKKLVEITSSEGVGSIIFKTSEYNNFEEFYNMFERILNGILDVEPVLGKALLKNAGLRYVDVIVPDSGHSLSDFISEEVIPMPLSMIEKTKHHFGVTLKRAETKTNQIISVGFEELLTNDGRVTKVLPDDLIERDPKCGLIINGQEQWLSVNSETYGILDVDHAYNFVGSSCFDVELIKKTIGGLYEGASEVFWGSITETAKKAWGLKEI